MLRFGLVGCGRISHRHAQLLHGDILPTASICGVCDIIVDKAKALASQYHVPYFNDYHEMCQATNPDVLVVLTESGNHPKHVIELSKYGKPIVVEKPISLRVGDGIDMIEACKASGSQLFVVKQNRFNRPILKLREAVESGRFGRITLGTVRVRWCRHQSYYDQDDWRGTWSMDGGVLTNQASHHIDMLQWMLGDVSEVAGVGGTQMASIEAEDTATVSLRFTSGAIGAIEATTAARPKDQEGSISILGENGLAEVAGIAMNEIRTWQFIEAMEIDTGIPKDYSTNPPNVYGYGHMEFYQHIINCITNGIRSDIDGNEGIKTVRIINAIYESMRLNKFIKLRDDPRSLWFL